MKCSSVFFSFFFTFFRLKQPGRDRAALEVGCVSEGKSVDPGISDPATATKARCSLPSRTCVKELNQELALASTFGNQNTKSLVIYLRTSVVTWESSGWALNELLTCCCCRSRSSELDCTAWLCRCRAHLRKAGQALARWGQDDQNHEGISPVGAVET